MPAKTHFKIVVVYVVVIVAVAMVSASVTYAQGLWGKRDLPVDDARITMLPDGTMVAEHADRTVEIRFSNLLRMIVTSDNFVTIAGTSNPITMARAELRRGEMSDGTAISPMADGALRVDLTDGSYIFVWADNRVDVGYSRGPDPAAPLLRQTTVCTFITDRRVNLRAGPGTEYDRVGSADFETELQVIGQGTSKNYYIWWKVRWPDYDGDVYVRSDLGESDCDPVCGNDVCEYAETSASCAADCGGGTGGGGVGSESTSSTSLTSTAGQGCYVDSCQDCYESVSCYPECNDCTCSSNAYGCVTCYCTTPSDSAVDTGSTGCDFASCDDCLAAFPCVPGPCSVAECSLNEFGCPSCYTSP